MRNRRPPLLPSSRPPPLPARRPSPSPPAATSTTQPVPTTPAGALQNPCHPPPRRVVKCPAPRPSAAGGPREPNPASVSIVLPPGQCCPGSPSRRYFFHSRALIGADDCTERRQAPKASALLGPGSWTSSGTLQQPPSHRVAPRLSPLQHVLVALAQLVDALAASGPTRRPLCAGRARRDPAVRTN